MFLLFSTTQSGALCMATLGNTYTPLGKMYSMEVHLGCSGATERHCLLLGTKERTCREGGKPSLKYPYELIWQRHGKCSPQEMKSHL